MNLIVSALLPLVLPVILGAVAFAVTQWMKREWAALDAAPPETKQIIVSAWAYLFNLLSRAIPQPLCLDGAAFCDPPSVAWGTVLSAAVAFALHGRRRK